ncbi:MAG TPA: hypothetical protein VL200_01735 [Lacunisphaera sp.]|jgi:hypothetical protein|nr:hypothetical protein [Lacunisphaera sp.]
MFTPKSPLFALALVAGTISAFAQSDVKEERINAAFLLALGRRPAPSELSQWQGQATGDVASLVAALDRTLDAATSREVAVRAAADAFGQEPSAAELAGGAEGGGDYTARMKAHLQSLAADRAAYAQVVRRAYQLVLGRDPYEVETKYWQDKPVVSFVLLAGCLENWARRNQPGLMVTAGTPTVSAHCRWLSTATLSPAVAAEARSAGGLQPDGNSNLAAAVGRNVVAVGGGAVASNGGIAFVAAGRPPD